MIRIPVFVFCKNHETDIIMLLPQLMEDVSKDGTLPLKSLAHDPAENPTESLSAAADKMYHAATTLAEIELYMRAALAQAQLALDIGEVPVGCVFVHEGTIIASGFNKTNHLKNGTLHAEIVSIDDVIKEQKYPINIFRECDLYVTCEPCIMCAAALSTVGIRHVYFGCHNDRFGGNGSVLSVHNHNNFGTKYSYDITPGIMKDEAVEMFRRFYAQENTLAPETKRRKKEINKDDIMRGGSTTPSVREPAPGEAPLSIATDVIKTTDSVY